MVSIQCPNDNFVAQTRAGHDAAFAKHEVPYRYRAAIGVLVMVQDHWRRVSVGAVIGYVNHQTRRG